MHFHLPRCPYLQQSRQKSNFCHRLAERSLHLPNTSFGAKLLVWQAQFKSLVWAIFSWFFWSKLKKRLNCTHGRADNITNGYLSGNLFYQDWRISPEESTTDRLSFYKAHSSVEYEALQKENAERHTILIQENFRHGFSYIGPLIPLWNFHHLQRELCILIQVKEYYIHRLRKLIQTKKSRC